MRTNAGYKYELFGQETKCGARQVAATYETTVRVIGLGHSGCTARASIVRIIPIPVSPYEFYC